MAVDDHFPRVKICQESDYQLPWEDRDGISPHANREAKCVKAVTVQRGVADDLEVIYVDVDRMLRIDATSTTDTVDGKLSDCAEAHGEAVVAGSETSLTGEWDVRAGWILRGGPCKRIGLGGQHTGAIRPHSELEGAASVPHSVLNKADLVEGRCSCRLQVIQVGGHGGANLGREIGGCGRRSTNDKGQQRDGSGGVGVRIQVIGAGSGADDSEFGTGARNKHHAGGGLGAVEVDSVVGE